MKEQAGMREMAFFGIYQEETMKTAFVKTMDSCAKASATERGRRRALWEE